VGAIIQVVLSINNILILREGLMIKKIAFQTITTIAFAGFVSLVQAAESVTAYAEKCKQELQIEVIPGYNCLNGISIPGNTGFGLPTTNNYLGKVFTDNPNVDAVFLCRDVSGGTAQLNGYILQNRVSGKTCFFDAKIGASTTVPSIDGSAATSNSDQSGNCAAACHRKSAVNNDANRFLNVVNASGAMPVEWGNSNYHQFYEQNPLDKISLKKKYRLQSAWAWDMYLNNQNGSLVAANIQPYWHSAVWSFEKNDEGYYLIKNYWKKREFLHIEQGSLVAGPALRGWWSAQWTPVEVTDVPAELKGKVFRLQNRWKPHLYINLENMQLKASTIHVGWHSARWYLDSVDGL
jgi:hypothetical protein